MSEEWECSTCTFINQGSDKICAMCSRSRPKPKVETVKPDFKAAPADPRDLQNIHGLALSNFATSLWGNPRFGDVTITIGTDSEAKTLLCHKIILSALSPVFNKLFDVKSNDKKEGEPGEPSDVKNVEIKDYKFEDVQNFFRAMYTGQVEVNEKNYIALSQLADRYDVPVVRTACGAFVEVKLTPETALKFYSTSGIGVEYVARNADAVFKADTTLLLSLPHDKLRRLVESDDLALEEIDVFRYVYRWGREELKRKRLKEKEKDKDVDKDTEKPKLDGDGKEDVQELRDILEELLKHVRFPLMTSEQLGSIVMPSRVIEPEKLIAVFTHVSLPKAKQDLVKNVQGFSARRRKQLNPRDLAKKIPSFFAGIDGFDDPLSPDKKQAVFDHYDQDKDGKLTRVELRVVVYHLCELLQRMLLRDVGSGDPDALKVQRLADDPGLVEKIGDMIEMAVGVSSDGFISRANFIDNLTQAMEVAVKSTLGLQSL